MMQYDFDMEENINSYPTYQQPHKYDVLYLLTEWKRLYYSFSSILKSTLTDNNMISSSDLWQSSPSNSNTNYQSFYFSSSFDSKEYQTIENHHFNYQSSFDHSSTSRIDPYSYVFSNNYPTESYSAPTGYNSPSIESSTYLTPTDSYHNIHSIYTDPNTILPSSTSSQWNFSPNKTPIYDGMYLCFTSRNRCQPVFFAAL
jgi:hypothetical protein